MAKTALDITEADMAIYRATAKRQREEKQQALRHRARRAQYCAKKAAQILKTEFGANIEQLESND